MRVVRPHADAGLRRALEVRSFRREVVLMLGSAGRMLLPLLQSIQGLEDMGMAHVLPLVRNEDTCKKVCACGKWKKRVEKKGRWE
jgi:hypothetical protein